MITSQIQTPPASIPAPARVGQMRALSTRPALVVAWLGVCAVMVFAMAIIGAITRLTESGLSITEWKPLIGALPPLSAADWDHVFALYQQTPEYIHKNTGMTLPEFKSIFFWEWIHRLWGRLIGLVYVIPFLIFALRGFLSRRLIAALCGLFVVGMTQGFIGWFMVQSGLIDRPSVSHYRLALHLGCALLLYALLIWLALSVRTSALVGIKITPRRPAWGIRCHTVFAVLVLALTIIWGAFVAGLDAGLIYNEFPTMGPGRLMPPEMWHLTPAWLNLFENHAAVQFTHRALAATTMIVTLALTAHALLVNRPGRVFPALALMVLVQAMLGIITLLSDLNIYAAVLHQGGAMILLGLMIGALHSVFYSPRAGDVGAGAGTVAPIIALGS